MENSVLLALVILLPILAGLLMLIVKRPTFRNLLAVVTTTVISICSIMLTVAVVRGGKISVPFQAIPEIQFGGLQISVGNLIALLDIALLGYIIYLGVIHNRRLIILLGLLQAIPMIFFESRLHPVEAPIAFMLDGLGVIMLLVISIVGSAIAIFAIGYMKVHEHHLHLEISRQPRFFAIIFLFLGAMNALVLTNNILWMYFFWEITTLCSFLLISHDGNEISIQNALRALWMNSIGGVAFVMGIIACYSMMETTDVEKIMQTLASGGTGNMSVLLIPIALFCFAGFTKSAQFPFQSWLLGAMVAPTPVSALLHSSTMVKAGVYIIVRFAPIFAGTFLGKSIAVVGAFTFMAGSAIAISQSNAKKVLAYSTIANLGLIIASASIGSYAGIAIGIILIVVHAISKALMFLCVGTIEQEIGSRDIEDMQGLMKKMPYTTTIMVLAMTSMLLPPFGVFMTKWLTIEAAVNMPLVLFLIVLGSAFTVVFWSQWVGIVLTMSYRRGFKDERLPVSMKTMLGFLLMLTFAASILIAQIYNFLVNPYIATMSKNFMTNDAILEANRFTVNLYNTTTLGGVVSNEHVGQFPVFVIFGVFLFLLALIPFYIGKDTSKMIRKPYLCGENTDDMKGTEAYMPGDKIETVVVRNYYLTGIFNEINLTYVLNGVAVLIILIMFGVVFNV